MRPVTRHIALRGDNHTGKNCFVSKYIYNKLAEMERQSFYETYSKILKVDGVKVQLIVSIPSGSDDYIRVRAVTYKPSTQLVGICFSIANPESLQNVLQKWLLEVKHHCGDDMPVILIGTKIDLRGIVPNSVSKAEGKAMAEHIGAVEYLECSATPGEGIEELFKTAIRVTITEELEQLQEKESTCMVS